MTEQPDETSTTTGKGSDDAVRRFTRVYRVGIDATPDTLDLDTRIEAFVQDLVQRGLRPVSTPTLDELSDPVGHHTQGRLPEGRPGVAARHADRRPPTGYRWATLGVDAVPAWAYDYQAAVDAHTSALGGPDGGNDSETGVTSHGGDDLRGYDGHDAPSDTPTYDQTAHDHLNQMIAESDQHEQG